MTTLVELNTFADGVVSYTENRPSFVFFNFPNATDLTEQSISTQSFTLQRTIDIVEIVKPNLALVVFEVDVSALSGTTVSFGSLPSGVTVTSLNGVFTVSGIDSVSDWEAVRSPTITLPSADHQGAFAYTCKIIATIDGVRTTKQWTVGTFKTIAELGATSSLSFTPDSLIKGASAHLIAAINVNEVEVEFAILARIFVECVANSTKDLTQTLSVVTSMPVTAQKFPSFGVRRGFQGGSTGSSFGRGLFGGKHGVGWAPSASNYIQIFVNTDDNLTSLYNTASGSEITNGVFKPINRSWGGSSYGWNNDDGLGSNNFVIDGPTELSGFTNEGTGISSGFYYGFALGVKNGRFYGGQWTGSGGPTQFPNGYISNDFNLRSERNKSGVINTATSQILGGYNDGNVPQIHGMALARNNSSVENELLVVDWFGQTFEWDTSTNSNFNVLMSNYSGVTRFDACASNKKYYAVLGQKPVGSGTGAFIIIRDAEDGSAVTTITGPAGKTFDRMCINDEFVGVASSTDVNSGTMVFRISDGQAVIANGRTADSVSMSPLMFATGKRDGDVFVHRLTDFVQHVSLSNPNLNTTSGSDYFGNYVLIKDDFLYVSAELEDEVVDPTLSTTNPGVVYRYQ